MYGHLPNISAYGYQFKDLNQGSIGNLSNKFLADYAGVLKIDPAQMKLREAETDGRMWFVSYTQSLSGVPVYRTEIGYSINQSGDVVALGADVFPDIAVSTKVQVTRSDAEAVAKTAFGFDSTATEKECELVVYPKEEEDTTRLYLTWKILLSRVFPLKETIFFIDAQSATITDKENNLLEANLGGQVTGSYWPLHNYDPTVQAGFKTTNIKVWTSPGGTQVADVNSDENGNYATGDLPAGSYRIGITLQNDWAIARDAANGNNPITQILEPYSPPATVNVNWGATDGTSVRWLMSAMHDYFKNTFSYSGTDYQMGGYVDAGTNENGRANGTDLYFGSDGGQYWARSSDIVYHEYAHNVIYHIYGGWIGSGDTYAERSAMDEGFADYFAGERNNDPTIGEDIQIAPYFPRYIQNSLRCPSNYETSSSGDDNADHWNGQIISGACWDVGQAVGQSTGANLVFRALQISPHAYFFNDFANNMIIADNNYYSGTHYNQIRTAFATHGIGDFHFSGIIGTSRTWSGTYIVDQDVTVYSGVTLTISPGTLVSFAPGTRLIVNGGLTADGGSSSTPIIFDFVSPNSSTHNGLQFNSGSNGTLSYCRVLNADRGIYENGVSVSVVNSAVAYCTNGIYLYNSSPAIQNCSIHDNSYAGVYTTSSSPNLCGDNYLQNNGYGVYCTTNSNPTFGSGSTQGMNNVTNNTYGVFCWNNSFPMLGQNSPVSGGYDNLVNTSWNVYNMSWYAIYANNNWWGTTNSNNFKIAGTGAVLYSPYLYSSLNIPAPPLSKSSAILSVADSNGIPMQSALDKAYQLFASGDFVDARNACLNLINNYPDYAVSFNALNLLTKTFGSNEIAGETGALQLIFNRTPKKDLYAAAGLLLANVDKANRGKWLDQVWQSYGSQSVGELALFDKFAWYYFDQQDIQSASGISRQLDSMFAQSQGAAEAHRILGDPAYYKVNLNPGQSLSKAVGQPPTSYAISAAYPNPFNPSTQISYSLPEAGRVSLVIYDVLGREIAILADGYQQAGRYTVTWHSTQNSGIPVSSGVYFARLRVLNDVGGVKFTKTSRLLLMK